MVVLRQRFVIDLIDRADDDYDVALLRIDDLAVFVTKDGDSITGQNVKRL